MFLLNWVLIFAFYGILQKFAIKIRMGILFSICGSQILLILLEIFQNIRNILKLGL